MMDSSDDENHDNQEPLYESEFHKTHQLNKKLLSVKYPGNVVNPDKAIETLGGIQDISVANSTKNRRLELRFRPNDGFCKPTCGDKHSVTSFLLRVRVKKSRIRKLEEAQRKKDENDVSTPLVNGNGNVDSIADLSDKIISCNIQKNATQHHENISENSKKQEQEDLSNDTEYQLPKLKILGRIDTEFEFTSLCDFQFLPMLPNPENSDKLECIHDRVYPVGIPPYSWMNQNVPLFLPPAIFSRLDSVQQYVPKTEVSAQKDKEEGNFIGKTRKRRAGLSNLINFNTPYVPTNPPAGIENAIKVKFLQTSHLERIKEIFEERPIWSKTALLYVTKFTNEQLKVLIPSVAYYFNNGPWRITWVRLGYDPRKDPEARKYQTLDYRLKAMHGLQGTVKCKRNYTLYTLPYKSTACIKNKAKILRANPTERVENPKKKHGPINENVYIYRPGTVPPSRQMFYQYCDVLVPEIQEMLAKYEGPPQGAVCHEKLGWFPKGFDDICREIINKQVRVKLRQMMNVPENFPTSLPRKNPVRPILPVVKGRKKYKKKSALKIKQPTKLTAEPLSGDEEMPLEISDGEWEDRMNQPSTSGL